MVSFSHTQRGTGARHWQEHGLTQLDELPITQIFCHAQRLVVLVAHPDDESLGAGGLIYLALRHGLDVTVLVGTFGEGSHPHSITHSPETLARLREHELRHAMDQLRVQYGSGGKLELLPANLPDGALAQHTDQIESMLRGALGTERCILASTYRDDGHPDHDVLGTIAARVAADRGLWHLEFPIWYWHWATAENDRRWQHWHKLSLNQPAHNAKHRAMAAHTSQIKPLSDQAGDEAILPPAIREHFEGTAEIFRVTHPEDKDAAAAADVFENLYRTRLDPWNYRTSSYEQRKLRIALACLPEEHYANIVELGCSIGLSTAALAQRCNQLLAIDASPSALAQAQQTVGSSAHVEFREALLPQQWPQLATHSVDLIVFSEIGYFLAADELSQMFAHCASALKPGGQLLLCHWLHPIDGWPLDGRTVHAMAETLGWEAIVIHEETDFLIEILQVPGAEHA